MHLPLGSPPFLSRAGGQVSDTPTLTAQDWGGTALRPGRAMRDGLGVWRSTLLLLLLMMMMMLDADADPRWSCFLYSTA